MGIGDVLAGALGTFSGAGAVGVADRLIFNKVIGFRGITEGVGCSTIVASLAHALSERTNSRVCVVDTNLLYPSMYAFLCPPFSTEARAVLKDWFSVESTLPERIIDTKFKNVSLLGCFNRRIVDAFSTTDSVKLVDDTFDILMGLFDIILVDLSHEWSQIAMTSAVKCNQIYTIVDPSARTINNITQSLNNLATSAVPFSKFRDAIITKYSVKGFTGLGDVMDKNRLKVFGIIPYSTAIYEAGTLGKTCWGLSTPDAGVAEFNEVIDKLVLQIVNTGQEPTYFLVNERDAYELAVENSDAKNKNKVRKAERLARESVLRPFTADELREIKEQRHTANKIAPVQDEGEDLFGDEPDSVGTTEFGMDTFTDTEARLDMTQNVDDINFGEETNTTTATAKKPKLSLFKKGGGQS